MEDTQRDTIPERGYGSTPIRSNGSATRQTASIHQFPLEILREIFIQCLTYDRTPNSKVAPLLLCHVCSTWRSVALSVHQLWSDLSLRGLYYQKDVAKAMRTFISATELWFRCVGQHCPLSYAVNLPSDATGHTQGRSLLFPLPPSLHKLNLEMADDSQLTDFAYLQTEALPLLETARISIGSDSPLSLAMHDFPFPAAPQLRKLTLDIAGDRLPMQVTTAPWKRLTQLILGREITLKAWHKIIRQCPLLNTCSVELDIPISPNLPSNLQFTAFTHLEDLTLLFSSGAFLDAAVEGLRFPALTALHLACDDIFAFDLTTESALRIFREAQLTNFTLRQGRTESTDLYQIMEITNMLRTLDIACNTLFQDFFSMLEYDEADTSVLPRLESLTLSLFDYAFEGDDDVDFDNDEAWYYGRSEDLVDAIKSRWWRRGADDSMTHRISRLKNVSLVIDEDHPKSKNVFTEKLAPLQEQGLNVHVSAGSRDDWSNYSHMDSQWQVYMDDDWD